LGLLRVSADREMPAPSWPWFQVDRVGGVSKCGDYRVRTLLYEAANVMLTRYKGQLKLRTAFAIAWLSIRRARVALISQSSCTPCRGTEPSSCRLRPNKPRDRRPHAAPRGAPPWGVNKRRRGFCCMRQRLADCDFNPAALHPAYPIKRRTSAQRTQAIRLRPLAARNERSFGDRRCKEAKNLQHGFRHEFRA
jgi:hypothetical protein